jgi:hypothetical protein
MKSLFPSQLSNQIILVMGEHAASNWMWELSAWLALQGNLRVLDAGNRFNAYPVAQAIRRQQQNPRVVLERIRLSRAFTCYQVDVLLEEWQPLPYPTLVFDLLSTFYDERQPAGKPAPAAPGDLAFAAAQQNSAGGGQHAFAGQHLRRAYGAVRYVESAGGRAASGDGTDSRGSCSITRAIAALSGQ